MARMPRIVVPGMALHIIQRGNNRQPVFFSRRDYRIYLETLQQAAATHECAIHAYVLMTNHVHLLLTPQHSLGASRLMQAIGRDYVRYVNKHYQRTGTLWQGRFKSALINSERYFLTCSRYIELNPVRAGMVKCPADYRWSSYRCNALGRPDGVITGHPLYEELGCDGAGRQSTYRSLFAGQIEEADLGAIRKGTNTGTVVGNDRFRKEVQAMTERRLQRFPHGGDRKSKRFRETRNGH